MRTLPRLSMVGWIRAGGKFFFGPRSRITSTQHKSDKDIIKTSVYDILILLEDCSCCNSYPCQGKKLGYTR
jgi:hypothetical protein